MSAKKLSSGKNLVMLPLSELVTCADMLQSHIRDGGSHAETHFYGYGNIDADKPTTSTEFGGVLMPPDFRAVRISGSGKEVYGVASPEITDALLAELPDAENGSAPVAPVSDSLTPDLTISDAAFRDEAVRLTIYLEHNVKDGSTPVKAENVPGDRGGLTKYGISEKAYPNVDIKNLTYDGALAIYRLAVWEGAKAHLLPRLWAAMVFDFYTTSGGNAWRCLQRTVEAFKPSGYTGVWDDGAFGAATLAAAVAAANAPYKQRVALFNDFTTRRIKFYNDIVANDATQAKFRYGWNKRAIWSMGYAQCLLKTANIL